MCVCVCAHARECTCWYVAVCVHTEERCVHMAMCVRLCVCVHACECTCWYVAVCVHTEGRCVHVTMC